MIFLVFLYLINLYKITETFPLISGFKVPGNDSVTFKGIHGLIQDFDSFRRGEEVCMTLFREVFHGT